MYPLKQSTAITVPIFIHDASGDAVLGLVDGGFTKRISKGSAAFGAMTVTITEMENGWYSVPIGTGHSDTLGILSMTFIGASGKQVNLQYRVEARTLDDLAFPTVSGRSLDVSAAGNAGSDLQFWLGVTPAILSVDKVVTSVGDMQPNVLNAAAIASGAITADKNAANSITSTVIADGALTAPKFAASAITSTVIAPGAILNTTFAANAIDAAAMATSGVNEIRDAILSDGVAFAGGDVITTTKTITLPGQEAPPLTPTWEQAIGWWYKTVRNRKRQTATRWELMADDETTVDAFAVVSDDGVTTIKEEIKAGP